MSDQNETYVRERWEWVCVRDATQVHFDDRREGWEWFGSLTWQMIPHLANSEAEAWLAARQFTEERLEAIRQVEEEIAWLKRQSVHKVSLRILARLQSALTDLQRGLKPGGKA